MVQPDPIYANDFKCQEELLVQRQTPTSKPLVPKDKAVYDQ